MSFHADVNLSFQEYNLLWDLLRREAITCRTQATEYKTRHGQGVSHAEDAVTFYLERAEACLVAMSKLEARFQH